MIQVGIVGLGLIGGSLAKAFQRKEDSTVFAWDQDASVLDFAKLSQAIDGGLTDKNISDCDLILMAVYPQGVIDWLTEKAGLIAPNAIVIDCSGTKKRICEACFPLAKQYGFTFVGGHPMAGSHESGFKFSRGDLFDGAPMVIVPPAFDDIRLLDRVSQLLEPVGFGQISITTAEEHDRIIAFSSQMAHVISNAYIKSPTAKQHQGFSAGSYRDLTRVAWLNSDMWTELFLENRACLLQEMDTFLSAMQSYRNALEQDDAATLRCLLEEGRQRKREVDGA